MSKNDIERQKSVKNSPMKHVRMEEIREGGNEKMAEGCGRSKGFTPKGLHEMIANS